MTGQRRRLEQVSGLVTKDVRHFHHAVCESAMRDRRCEKQQCLPPAIVASFVLAPHARSSMKVLD
ncbi:MAG TPA: hypothetical protein VGC19_01260 [Rhodanobacter sp.]